MYAVGNPCIGTACVCPPGSDFITTAMKCNASAQELSEGAYPIHVTRTNLPTGCYSDAVEDKIYFNDHVNGTSLAVVRLVCYRGMMFWIY